MKKNFVAEITNMNDDFARWYTDVVVKTELVDYSPVKGFMVIRPYGFTIWENIKEYLDKKLKETNHENMYFPLLIPESLLKKEADHVEGFAPEVAWVTHGGDKELSERLCIRPTSETIFCSMYAKWLSSYRDLPYLYNQWANVVRWEKTTRPFLRTTEFLWQEGHTLHETKQEANTEALKILEIYQKLAKDILAIPVITGVKSENEKFAGAEKTYTIEALMHDGKALQAGTSHFLGQHFSKAFDIKYLDQNGQSQYPYQTSWGVTTRLIGALIMVHGDNRGLVLPPNVAPIQVVIVPIAAHKNPKVLEVARELSTELSTHFRVKLDDDLNTTPGFKFNHWEMKGVPIRVEIGPRDIENNHLTLCRRDNNEKSNVSINEATKGISNLLTDININLYNKALKQRNSQTYVFSNYNNMLEHFSNNNGLADIHWCGSPKCELHLKNDMGLTIRCIHQQVESSCKCVVCGKESSYRVYAAKAY